MILRVVRFILLAVIAACATSSLNRATGDGPTRRPPEAKLDPAVAAAMDSQQTVQVILLGHTQLFDRRGGIEGFAARHADADRRTLRPVVLARLKAIASREQREILSALRRDSAQRSLWISNAMVLTLSPAEIRAATRLSQVEFIYPSYERLPEPEKIGKLSEVLPPVVDRPRFTDEGKRISWNVERLGAPRVWRDLDDRGEGVTVAVLDGGANYAHTDLRNAMWRNRREIPGNGIDDDHNGYVDDYYGYDFGSMRAEVRDTSSQLQHGTLTSGMVGGDGTRGIITASRLVRHSCC
jgi:subtilisin family serine protease